FNLCALAIKPDDKNETRLVVRKAIWFRRPGIPDAIRDARNTVPITEGEIIKTGLRGTRRIDGHRRFAMLAAEALDRAMRQPDPVSGNACFGGVHPCCRIAYRRASRKRSR